MQPSQKQMSVPEAVLAAMRRTNELFDSEVVARGNIDAVDRIYTARAHVLPPGAPMIEGREEIKKFWKQAIVGMSLSSAKLTIVNAELAGDGVIEIGRADLTTRSGQVVTAKYVVHWKQEDGAWKWNVDIWNANQ